MFGMLTTPTHVSLPRSVYWEDLNTVIIPLQIVVAVFCSSKLFKKGTHLRAKGKKVTCPGHKDCICNYSSEDHHKKMKREKLRIASMSFKVMTVLSSFHISPMIMIMPLILVHLKSKAMSVKTSETCTTSLTLKENILLRLHSTVTCFLDETKLWENPTEKIIPGPGA